MSTPPRPARAWSTSPSTAATTPGSSPNGATASRGRRRVRAARRVPLGPGLGLGDAPGQPTAWSSATWASRASPDPVDARRGAVRAAGDPYGRRGAASSLRGDAALARAAVGGGPRPPGPRHRRGAPADRARHPRRRAAAHGRGRAPADDRRAQARRRPRGRGRPAAARPRRGARGHRRAARAVASGCIPSAWRRPGRPRWRSWRRARPCRCTSTRCPPGGCPSPSR